VPVLFGVATGLWSTASLDALLRSPRTRNHSRTSGIVLHADTPLAQVLKTYFTSQGGKNIWCESGRNKLTDGIVLNGVRAGGLYRLMEQQQQLHEALSSEIVALSRLEGIKTGDTLSSDSSWQQNYPKRNT